VDYAVTGAFALSVHGAIRGTMDVDAVVYTLKDEPGLQLLQGPQSLVRNSCIRCKFRDRLDC